MSWSNTSSWSCFFVNSTTRMVMGNTTISYSVFLFTLGYKINLDND